MRIFTFDFFRQIPQPPVLQTIRTLIKIMKKSSDVQIDPEKIFSPAVLKTNLLLSSLYLTAFEILKMAIIEGVKDFFIIQTEVTDEVENEMLKSLQKDLVEQVKESYKGEVDSYEREIGIRIDDRDKLGLIPSCKWLQRQEVLSEININDIKGIRDHRNEIAHELPKILIGKGFDIKLEHFQKMSDLIHKVDVFWFRNDALFDVDTHDEVEIQDISDDKIISSRDSILALITNTVLEYLQEISQENNNSQ